VNDFIARRKDKYLFLVIHLLPLCYEHLNVSQWLRSRYLASFVAQKSSPKTIIDTLRTFEDDPLRRRLSLKFNIVDRGPVLLAVGDLKKGARCKVKCFGICFGILGRLSEKFKTGNPFLF